MKAYLFIGDTGGNTGPSNVNKGIVSNLSEFFCVADSKYKLVKYVTAILNTMWCKVVVVSGISKVGLYAVRLAKFLGKKTIYIMHGCYEIECALNELKMDQSPLQMEMYILKHVDLILPVSKRYGEMIQERYPFCKGKTEYLHNGIEKIEFENKGVKREQGRIIAVGGDRKLKNNITIARAMAKMESDRRLAVYGHLYQPDNLPKSENIEFLGLVPQRKLYKEMMRSELYVLNSTYEPFALSVFDALLCGCSILVTHVAGALELLKVTEHDVIQNPMNEDEIAEKIEYLLCHPNNERLVQGLDFETISYKAQVKKLENYCKIICSKVG